MANYSLNANKQNEVLYLMRAGKDYVYGLMPYANAIMLCENGTVTRGDNPAYPVAVDGKYFFSGKFTDVGEEAEMADEAPAKPKGKRKHTAGETVLPKHEAAPKGCNGDYCEL